MSRSNGADERRNRSGEQRDRGGFLGSLAEGLERGVTGLVMLIGKAILAFFMLIAILVVLNEITGQLLLSFVLSPLVLVGGRRLYRRYRRSDDETDEDGEEDEDDEEEAPDVRDRPDDEPTRWRDIVVEEVEERRERKDLVLRNLSDGAWDLSGAVIVDNHGEEFTIRDGWTIEPGERESLPVAKSLDAAAGTPLTLRTREGQEHRLLWRNSLRERQFDE